MRILSQLQLTEEDHEGGEAAGVVAESELGHDQVDGGGEEGAAQGGDEPGQEILEHSLS